MDKIARTCPYCGNILSSIKLRNRHVKNIHNVVVGTPKVCRIVCPLCPERTEVTTHENLRKHLEENHHVNMELLILNFSSLEDYELWKNESKLEISYVRQRISKLSNHTEIQYVCNRSDYKGHRSQCAIRTEKSGGSIKIRGICPSTVTVKIFDDGKVNINFWKTHAGHDENELRSKHLSKDEKKMIVGKLEAGVSTDRILEDARKVETPHMQRINLLNKTDVDYLSRKFNIEKRRDKNEMVAVALKVKEWNSNDKNFAFFFKNEGQTHELLRNEDFAVGFMNSTMEDKLKRFTSIICMDGTHGTNKKGLDLTIMLIKDDKNAGFPVAFFLSNRVDQIIQEVFLGALRKKIGREIKPGYFMSDDDPKYYNAWIKTMENKPRRLLCSWHIVKNWNIQGKKKIHDLNMKRQMKFEMRKILNENCEEEFIKLSNLYLGKLEAAKEDDFRNYLIKNYFQNAERIEMWAHCYRKNAGINTNMALESLNNLLKTNQLKRRTSVTVEKLLDKIEELVDLRMWNRILNMKRPNANNYQDRIIIKAHKKAEVTKNNIEVIETSFRNYRVKSNTGERYFNVHFMQVCESECTTLFCRVCKICIHRYECDCPQYAVRNTMCKHVHLVRMYEERKGTNFVLDEAAEALGTNSIIKKEQSEETAQFLEEKQLSNQEEQTFSEQTVYLWKHFINQVENLCNEDFERVVRKDLEKVMDKVNRLHQQQVNNNATRKRKMEKQNYFPTKKRSENEHKTLEEIELD